MNNNERTAIPEPVLPVAGIVASAGGLEAFKRFFQAMPVDSGIAFVLIPHLDPRHESLMAPILAKQTNMPVIEAEEGQRLQANHVYVIPPDRYLSLHDGVIQLRHPPDGNAGETAIDPFLRSLADDQQECAIAIVLSGTGSHGALGCKVIKAAGGMVMVQEPSSAEHDNMPRNAKDTGLADYVLRPEQMPEDLIRYVRHFVFKIASAPEPVDVQDDLTRVLALLRARSKFDFRAYRKPMLLRRIQRRMGLKHIENFADYLDILREQPEEHDLLRKDLLISVTSFFRDPEMFEVLETRVLTDLLENRDEETPLRVWVPGCATGEEAYSIAMLLIERLEALGEACALQVFATDVDEHALDIARRGIYVQALLADVDRRRLVRFFNKVDTDQWQVKQPLREAILFASQNLLSDAPFSKLDLISCRNLLIYLEPHIQQQLLELFHFALNDDGYLILGPSESIGRHRDLYQPFSSKWRIFRRVNASRPFRAKFPIQSTQGIGQRRHSLTPENVQGDSLSDQVRDALLAGHAPTAVVVDSRYEVLHYSGLTHFYLQQPGGAPTSDLISMAHPGLRSRIRAAMSKAMQKAHRIDLDATRIERDGSNVLVRITAEPLSNENTAEGLFLVTFKDEPQVLQNKESHKETLDEDDESILQRLEYELRTTREELQGTIEEQESSNEELMASNEEAMSMNEELQSTNEELETSKEELQSLNEELGTVNAQLQNKVEELEESTSDMANLIASVDTAILFLGADSSIQRFTPSATGLFNLIDTDLGRPISDITRRFEDENLMRDIDRVLKKPTAQTSEVLGEGDRWYLRSITPYQTSDNRLEGVVLTFTEITPIKRAQLELQEMAGTLEKRVDERSQQLREEHNFNSAVLDTVASLVLVIDREQRVVRFNRACETVTGYDFEELVGTGNWWKLVPAGQQQMVREVIERLLAGEDLVIHENHWLTRDGSERLLSWNNTVLKDDAGEVQCIIGTGLDITEQRNAEIEARRHLEDASRLQRMQTANELATLLAHELNQPLAAIAMFAESGRQLLGQLPLQQDKLGSLLTQVSEQALRAGEIIRRLRKFVGRGRITLAPTDLNVAINQACSLIQSKASIAGIHILFEPDEALPSVMADEVHLEQVMLNLMRNAVEAIREAAMTEGTITISTHLTKENVRVSFRDTGPGIDAKSAAALFGPLSSTKEHGLGMGLRISRSLIEVHGGRLWVEPHTPGAIFHFTLELAP